MASPGPPSFSAGCCFLPSPEGRPGVGAWALRGTERTPPCARKGRYDEKDPLHDHSC